MERSKDLIRMELQIGQLIRIIATMNERIRSLEETERNHKVIPIHTRQLKNQ